MTNQPFCHHGDRMEGVGRESRLAWFFQGHKKVEKVKSQNGGVWVRNALANNLESWGERVKEAREPRIKEELSAKVEKGKAYLDQLRVEINSPTAMEWAMAEWDRLNALLGRLDAPEAKFIALVDILDSDLQAFLDPETLSRSLLAREAIIEGARIDNVVHEPTIEPLIDAAEKKWESTHRVANAQVNALKNADTRSFYGDEIGKGVEEAKYEWIRKNIKAIERDGGRFGAMADKIPDEALDRIKTIVTEAKLMLQERLAERLEKKVDEVQTRAGAYLKKWESELNPNTVEEVRRNVEAARNAVNAKIRLFDSGGMSPSEALVSLNGLVSAFEAQAESSLGWIESQDAKLVLLAKDKGSVVRGIARNEGKLVNFANEARKRENVALMGASVAGAARLAKAGDEIALGQLESDRKMLLRMGDEKALEPLSDLNGLRGEELIARSQEAGDAAEVLMDAEKADLARKAMNVIQSANTVEEALGRLSETVGAEHVEYVPSETFEAEYRRYTTTGFMVFAVRGDEWKVIVDEGQVRSQENADLLKEQLTHELRHLEFEGDVELRESWRKSFVEGLADGQWEEVKAAFVNEFPGKTPSGYEGDKKVFEPGDWSDSDVLSELYAMYPDWSFMPAAVAAIAYGAKSEASKGWKILGAEGHGKGKDDKDAGPSLPMSREALEKSLKEIIGKIETYEKSPYIDHVHGGVGLLAGMRKIAKTAMARLGELERDGKLGNVDKLVKKLGEDLEGEGDSVKGEIREISESMPNPEKNPLRAFWNNTHIYSAHAFVEVYHHAKDYFERWLKKNHAIHKGNLSKHIFEGIHEGLALESSSFISGAWKEAIGGWEEKLKSKDPSKLQSYLKDQSKMAKPDKGVVLAVINIMTDKGTMNWINEDMWTCLNKMQNVVRFDHPADRLLYTDRNYLREKLKKAFGAPPVYNKAGAFNDKDRSNTNAYETKKNEYKSVILSAPALIGPRLRKLLMKKRGSVKDGEYYKGDKNIDPAEYEELLDLSLENGLFSPESVIFYLMCGMACGLLQPGTGSKLAKHFGAYPVMDYFNDKASEMSTPKGVRAIIKKNFDKEYLECAHGGKGSAFMRFYWTEMLNNGRVLSRMTQKVEPGGQNWDHDWSRAFAMCGDAGIAKTILKGPSASPITKKTQPPNIYAGILQWLEQNSEKGVSTSKDLIVQRIGYYFAFESILSGAAYATDKSYFRGTDFDKSKPPREHDSTNHPGMSVIEIESKLNGMMGSISPKLGELLALAIDKQSAITNPEAHLARIKALLGGIGGSLANLDDFYNNIGHIVAALLSSMSAESLLAGIRKGAG